MKINMIFKQSLENKEIGLKVSFICFFN